MEGGTLDWYFDAGDILTNKTNAEYVLIVRHPGSDTIWSISRIHTPNSAEGIQAACANLIRNKFGDSDNEDPGNWKEV